MLKPEIYRERLESRRRTIRAQIEHLLRSAGENGATRKEIWEAVGHRARANAIERELAFMQRLQLATKTTDPKGKNGKSAERWKWVAATPKK